MHVKADLDLEGFDFAKVRVRSDGGDLHDLARTLETSAFEVDENEFLVRGEHDAR